MHNNDNNNNNKTMKICTIICRNYTYVDLVAVGGSTLHTTETEI